MWDNAFLFVTFVSVLLVEMADVDLSKQINNNNNKLKINNFFGRKEHETVVEMQPSHSYSRQGT